MSEGESQGFFSGFVRLFQSITNVFINALARGWDWILRAIAAIGSFFLGLVNWLFQFALTCITRILALPAMIGGAILAVVGSFFGIVIGVILTQTSFPLYVQTALHNVFNGLGINGFFYFLQEYLALNNLIQFGLIYLGFTFMLTGFGVVFRLLWGLVPKF